MAYIIIRYNLIYYYEIILFLYVANIYNVLLYLKKNLVLAWDQYQIVFRYVNSNIYKYNLYMCQHIEFYVHMRVMLSIVPILATHTYYWLIREQSFDIQMGGGGVSNKMQRVDLFSEYTQHNQVK